VQARADYSQLRQEDPHSILVIPATNKSVDVNAPDYFLATISQPLANRGYYVFPVNMVRSVMADDGLSDADMVHASDPRRLGQLFGADAIMYISIERWEAKYVVLSTKVTVELDYTLKSAKTGSVLWTNHQVDEALCFGWIDGVRKRIDEHTYQIRFTPRKSDSIWSAVNIAKFESLSAKRKMTAAGAVAYGRRTDKKSVIYAYEQEQMAELSVSEVRAFRQAGSAWEFLQGTPPSYRKVVLHWVVRAKKPETRASRFQKLLHACTAGERLR
jgi:uncharacterized protein YdeI (YjbR/CyaY-like superfamily)